MTKRVALFVCLASFALAVGCGRSEPAPTESPKAKRPSVSGGEVNRPLAGSYVYELAGIGGSTLPPGAEITENLTISGDETTSTITNNQTTNKAILKRRWTKDRMIVLSSRSVRPAEDITCEFKPPIQILVLPLRKTKLPQQHWSNGEACTGTTDVEIAGRVRTVDAKGNRLSVWRITERTGQLRPVTGRFAYTTTIHYFSPYLGVDVRTETDSPALHSSSVLRSYP